MKQRLAGPLVLLLITIGLYWKLVLSGGQYTWLNSPDLATQVLPWFQFQAREWHRGHFPLWDPYNWGGQSLVGRTEPGLVYPLNWLLFLLPLDNGRISLVYLNWYYVLMHYFGALFCYWLCRDLGRSVAAGVVGGTAFAMGGLVGNLSWPQMLNGAVWGPLVVLFFLRAMRGQRPFRNVALSGAFLGVSLLSGHHQIPIYVTLLVAGLWLYYRFSSGRGTRHFLALAAIFGCFALLLGAAQVLPSYEYGKLSVRWVGAPNDPIGWQDKVPYSVHDFFSLHPVSVLGIVIPELNLHMSPFAGLVVVALALIAVVMMWQEREVRVFGAIAAGGILFALGAASVFHGWIYALVPVVEKARSPFMAVYIFALGAAVLAAFGLDALCEPVTRSSAAIRRLAAGLWAVSALIYVTLLVLYLIQERKVFLYRKPANVAFAGLLAGGVLLGFARGGLGVRAARRALVLVLLLELGNVTGFDFFHRSQGWELVDRLSDNLDVARFLESQPAPFRVEIDRDAIPFNFGEWHEIEETGGNSGITANIWRLNGERNAHTLLGERFYVGRKPNREDQAEVFQARSGIKVYRNPEAFPRVWTVHELAASNELARPLSELRQRAFMTGVAPALDRCGGDDDVQLLHHGKNRLVVKARMQCRGMVIVADTYFPGWQATVDGRSAEVREAYGFLRGVVVDAGEHRLEMRFRPRSLVWGAVLTTVGVLGLIVLCGSRNVWLPERNPLHSENRRIRGAQ